MALAEAWDAILLDLSLPGMDGLTLCRRLREQAGRDTPVLTLTAPDALGDKLAEFVHGADDYLVRPSTALNLVVLPMLALRYGRFASDEAIETGPAAA